MKKYFKCPAVAQNWEQSIVRDGVRRYYDIEFVEAGEDGKVIDTEKEKRLIEAGFYPTLTEALETETAQKAKGK